jgi:hypothetical protein
MDFGDVNLHLSIRYSHHREKYGCNNTRPNAVRHLPQAVGSPGLNLKQASASLEKEIPVSVNDFTIQKDFRFLL